MKKQFLVIISFSIIFLFLIQLAGTLVESIYILDLMNTSLDEKVLGLLFFFSPALLYLIPRKRPGLASWLAFGLLFLARGLMPYLDTLGRMLAAGIGTGAALLLLPLLLPAWTKEDPAPLPGSWISAGMALAVGFSVLLRTVGFGLDYSLLSGGSWVGWGSGAALGFSLTSFTWKEPERSPTSRGQLSLSLTGIFLVIGLAWFAFSAPAAISRWTEGNYRWIVIAVSLLSLVWAGISFRWQDRISKIPPAWLLAWNLAFTLALTLTILAHRIPFPESPASAPVLVGSPSILQQLPLAACLLLFPVIFLDLQVLTNRTNQRGFSHRDLAPGMLLGSFSLVLMVFFQIFSNVWGYVEPVSPWFRNKFWLPYTLMAGLLTVLVGLKKQPAQKTLTPAGSSWSWTLPLAALFLITAGGAYLTTRTGSFDPPSGSITVMTYNIQQANDDSGERSYQQQLALIRQVDPDILALQESDSTRVSLNNNDYVRYYAGLLGYYSYYGPTTVTGTYGTAILSKYPLENTRSIFSFSDQDEIGTAEAEVLIGDQRYTIFNVHPDGSDTAMLAWAETLLERTRGISRLIVLGDYNLRDYEEAYQRIDSVYTNAWVSVYPSKISPDGTDMSGENRIDHIFLSSDLSARDPVYILPPESATDHPVHWAEIIWQE